MSIHRVDVVRIKLEPHSNADSLSLVNILGYTVVVRTADWHDGQLAAYVEPDMVVPADRPEFGFLSTSHKQTIKPDGSIGYRIRVKRLRGVMSMGLLIPAPPNVNVGDNVIDLLGIVRYEPTMKAGMGGEAIAGPDLIAVKYDVESAYRYSDKLIEGEMVVATEKIHGANARFVFHDGRMYCGSRTEWKRQDANNLWWKALANHPELQSFCELNPDTIVYGEVYGQVQDLKYNGGIHFLAFDLFHKGKWIDYELAKRIGCGLSWVPEVYTGPWHSNLFQYADGKSLITPTQIREGIVVKPIVERTDIEIGRVQVKIVSNSYLERQ